MMVAIADNSHPTSALRVLATNFGRSTLAKIGLFMLVSLLLVAILAPLLAPQNPYDLTQIDILDGGLAPGSRSQAGSVYWLGTDMQGRDMFSAIMYGLRISLGVALCSATLAAIIGASVGLFAAYVGGRVEAALMRLVDLQLSFPAILIALMILAVLGKGVSNVIFAIVIVEWAVYARASRASALVEKRKEYVEAAISMGARTPRVLLRHILPNCLNPLIVLITVQIARAITLEATLSFLGLGVPITEPSLGLLIANGYQYMLSGKFWISIYPGAALLITVLALNLVGDRLRDVLNPRSQN